MDREKQTYTFLELIQCVSETAVNDDEVMATVTYLINSGHVRLGGSLAGATIDTRSSPLAFLSWVRSNLEQSSEFKLTA